MNLLTRVLLQLIITSIIAIIVFWFVSSVFIDIDHDRFQKDNIIRNMQLGYNLIYHDLESINTTVKDISEQEEIGRFLIRNNLQSPDLFPPPPLPPTISHASLEIMNNSFGPPPKFPSSIIPSLSEENLLISKLDYVYIYNSSGAQVYQKEVSDLKKLSDTDLDMIHSLILDNLVYNINSKEYLKDNPQVGFIQASDNLLLYASSPVNNSKGSVIGTIISGRILTDQDINYYSSILSSNISITTIRDISSISGNFSTIGSISSGYKVISKPGPSGGDAFTIYPTLGDGDLIFSGSWPILQLYNDIKYFIIGGYSLVFFIFIVIILYILESQVLSRMRRLKNNMKKIESEETLSIINPEILLMPGNDDISDFSKGLADLVRHILKANKDLSDAKKEAESANLAKSIFLANMSHEIRTPLNAIIGFSSLMEHEKLGPRINRYVCSINSAGNCLLSLINDILDLSKIDANKLILSPGPADLKQLCNEMELIFSERAHEKGVSFILSLPVFVPLVYIDETRVRQVLLNIVGNAVKFTETGTISLLMKIQSNRIEQSIIFFIVEDTGIGISSGYMNKIFNAFEQQDPSLMRRYGGTGLGLSISRKLINLMNGTISVESEQGKGSRFTIKIPCPNVDESVDTEKKIKISDLPVFSPEDILIVDDVENNRVVLADMLTKMGLNVRMASSPDEAIRMFKDRIPDLVFTDIRMPGMSGDELLIKIRDQSMGRDIPVIALTAIVNPEDEIKTDLFDEIIIKPIRIENIIPVLLRYFTESNQSYTSPGKKGSLSKNIENKYSKQILDDNTADEADQLFSERMSIITRKFIPQEVSLLADELDQFAELNKVEIFHVVAKDLRDASDEFDIKMIKKLVKFFQELVRHG